MITNNYIIKPYSNLGGADLEDANLEDANLRGANLRDANLIDANLIDANFRCANFRDANLRGADLIDANLIGANLIGANLEGANLKGANLRGADLRGANLKGANLIAYGDNNYLKTMQLEKWNIGYTHDTLQIGCQTHPIEKWNKWNTKAGRIWLNTMDPCALEWADKHLALILSLIKISPCKGN